MFTTYLCSLYLCQCIPAFLPLSAFANFNMLAQHGGTAFDSRRVSITLQRKPDVEIVEVSPPACRSVCVCKCVYIGCCVREAGE